MDIFLVALAVAAGVDRVRLTALILCLFAPWVLALVVVTVYWTAARAGHDRTSIFCEAVAAELRAGSSLRQAVAAASHAAGEPALAAVARSSGLDMLGRAAAEAFPAVGRELSLAVSSSARSGAPSADLFDELASLAIAHEEIRREVRVASAPGRATAGVLVGAPTLYLGWRWTTGDLAGLFASSGQRAVAAAGITLFLIGLAGALFFLRRAR